mgnify:FL=1
MSVSPRRHLLPALLFLFLGVGGGHGFLIQTYEGPGGKVQQRWRQPDRITFVQHGAGSDDLSPELTHRLIRESFQVWEKVPTSQVRFTDQGTTDTRVPTRRDRRQLIFFDETGDYLQVPSNSGVIAITRTSSNDLTGEILDADIIFNGRDFRFAGDGDRPSGHLDLKDIAIHEIGHLLGLDHTPLDGPPDIRPTMNPFNRGDGPGEGQSLEADDVAGVSVLYPAPGYLESVGAITGTVADADGISLFGVHLMTENIDTGELFSTLSGAYPELDNPGQYLLPGLTPGSYRLRISPIGGVLSEENFGGIFTGLATDFPAEYYDNASSTDLARLLVLSAGEQMDGIDFTAGFATPGYPSFEAISLLPNTPDPKGPYLVQAQVADAVQVWLNFRTESDRVPSRIPMEPAESGRFTAHIPGHPEGARIFYQVEARSPQDNTLFFPHADEWLQFDVVKLSGSPLVFTALRGDDVISVIDTGDRRELARIQVGDEPIQLLLDEPSDRLFVSNLSSNELFVIDTATFQVVDRIQTSFQPLDMALAPDGKTLYVTNSGAGTLALIDVPSGTATTLSLARIGSGPFGIAAAGEFIYTTDIANDQVLVIAPDGSILQRLNVPSQPRSLAVSPDGSALYLASLGSDQLTVIDPRENQIVRTISLPVNGTFAVAPSPDGRKVYLTAHEEGVLVVVDAQLGTVLRTLTIGSNPRAISFSPDGQTAFVTNSFSNEITIVDTKADAIIGRYETGENPRGIALDLPILAGPGTAVRDETASLPTSFILEPNFPNPFNASTRITYSLPERDVTIHLELLIFDVLGREIRTLARGHQAPGTYSLEWDGKNSRGERLASGVYLLLLRAGPNQQVQKMLLLQ